ncbi:MAG: cupin domain-containing protein [Bacteroidales bacterium]|nr:cupin domain-containing protein [Bacteroidales bacterium]
MKRISDHFCFAKEIEWEDLSGGLSRKILGRDNQIMMVKVRFEPGAIGALHQHFHTQTTYCAKGKFEFTIGEEKQIINYGDGVYVPPNLQHSVVCLEEGILIDVFSPVREDFLDGSVPSYLAGNQ